MAALVKDTTLVALGLHYEDLATELRMEMVRTAENNPGANRVDFIADIARRFTTISEADPPELVIVLADGSDAVVTISPDGTRQCPECEVGVMALDDHEWVCAACGWGEPEDEVRQVLQCPHCGGVDVEVKEVDKAERWNTAEPEIVTVKEGLQLNLDYHVGDSQFDHDHYECGSCDRRVALPSGATGSENWG